MAEFSTAASLELTVPQSELRAVRDDIEEAVGEVAVSVDGSSGGRRRGSAGQSIVGQQQVPETLDRIRAQDETRNELLAEILDELDGVGGGGGGGNLLPRGGSGLGGGGIGGIGLGLGLTALTLLGTGFNIETPDIPPLEAPDLPPLEVPDVGPIPVDAPDDIPVDVPTIPPLKVPDIGPIPVDAPDGLPVEAPEIPPLEVPPIPPLEVPDIDPVPVDTPDRIPVDVPFPVPIPVESPGGTNSPEPSPSPDPAPDPSPSPGPEGVREPIQTPGGVAGDPNRSPDSIGSGLLPDEIGRREILGGGAVATGLEAARRFSGGLSGSTKPTGGPGIGFPIPLNPDSIRATGVEGRVRELIRQGLPTGTARAAETDLEQPQNTTRQQQVEVNIQADVQVQDDRRTVDEIVREVESELQRQLRRDVGLRR